MQESQLFLGQLDRMHDASLPPGRWLVPAILRRPDRNPLQALVACDRLTCHLGIDPNDDALTDLDLLSGEAEAARALHVEVDLLLVRLRLVVLEALGSGREVEVVDAES